MVIMEVSPVVAAELAGTQLRSAQGHGLPGGAGSGNRLLEAVVRIVGILNPVDNGVLGIGVALPLGGEGNALSQFAAEGESGIPIVPAQEGIALTGGLSGFHGIGVGGHEGGGGIAAAFGIIGNPVAPLYLGVQGHIGAVNGDGFHPVGQSGLSIPAGDGLVGIHGEGGIGGNLRAVGSLLGGADHTLRVQEEHVVHLLEVSFICIGLPAYKGLCAEEVFFTRIRCTIHRLQLPAHELVAILLRGGRSNNRLARFDGLGGYDLGSILEHIGIHHGINGLTLTRLNNVKEGDIRCGIGQLRIRGEGDCRADQHQSHQCGN